MNDKSVVPQAEPPRNEEPLDTKRILRAIDAIEAQPLNQKQADYLQLIRRLVSDAGTLDRNQTSLPKAKEVDTDASERAQAELRPRPPQLQLAELVIQQHEDRPAIIGDAFYVKKCAEQDKRAKEILKLAYEISASSLSLPEPLSERILSVEATEELVAEIKERRADWLSILREIAKLSNNGQWNGEYEAPDDTALLEEFDPWKVLRRLQLERAEAGTVGDELPKPRKGTD